MPLSKTKMQDMWRAGYCEELIRAAHAKNRRERVLFLREHVQHCVECRKANLLKNAEMEVATALGPHAVQLFMNGGDITELPEYRFDVAKPILDKYIAPEMLAWLQETLERPPLDLSDLKDTPTN